jgi:hypothetical protein
MECENFLGLFKRLLQEWGNKGESLEIPVQRWLAKDKKHKKLTNEASKTPLSAIPKSCCPQLERETLIFDFDTVMKNFCTKINMLTLSSVDGLYLDEQRNIIYLLEIKSVASHLERSQKSTMDSEEKFESIKKFLLEGEDDLSDDELKNEKKKKRSTLADKAGNSYTSFFAMFGYSPERESSYNLPLVRCFLEKKQFKIKYFIVVDMESEDFLKYEFAILKLLKQKITHGFLSSIELVSADHIHEILENTFDEII